MATYVILLTSTERTTWTGSRGPGTPRSSEPEWNGRGPTTLAFGTRARLAFCDLVGIFVLLVPARSPERELKPKRE